MLFKILWEITCWVHQPHLVAFSQSSSTCVTIRCKKNRLAVDLHLIILMDLNSRLNKRLNKNGESFISLHVSSRWLWQLLHQWWLWRQLLTLSSWLVGQLGFLHPSHSSLFLNVIHSPTLPSPKVLVHVIRLFILSYIALLHSFSLTTCISF